MKARDYRQQAWTAMNGKWGMAALIAFVYTCIMGVADSTGIGGLLLTGPLTLGMIIVATNIIENGEIKIEQLFKGFDRFGDTIILSLLNSLFVFLWSLLFVIPGIIAGYSYSMSYYILKDNPSLSPNEARKRSIEMMKGNKWRLFCLHFSFIGWHILGALTAGILEFWIIPYQQAAEAAFYKSLLPVAEAVVPPQPVEA